MRRMAATAPWSARFATLVEVPDAAVPLDEAALVIAAHARPDLDLAAELARIDELAAGVRDPTLTGVVRQLFRDERFVGNRDDYYDPRNSYLDEVVRRRTGIPITLGVLMMEVGRRVQVPLSGVAMPGHFLLRDKVDPGVFVDPFTEGRLLDAASCARLFRQVHGPAAQLDPSFLEPVSRVAILARILANLRGIFSERNDRASLRWVLHLRTLLPSAGPVEHAEHAEVLAATGELLAAADTYERVAAMIEDGVPDSPDAASARDAAHRLRARLN